MDSNQRIAKYTNNNIWYKQKIDYFSIVESASDQTSVCLSKSLNTSLFLAL